MVSAELARVRRPVRNAMMLCNLVALRAVNAVWIEPVFEPFQTRRIVWKLPIELHHRERAV